MSNLYFVFTGTFSAASMMTILRDTDSCICRIGTGARNIASTGSQVSVLRPDKTCFHWFTATPNPACSAFKPFVFTLNLPVSLLTKSRTHAKDPAKQKPRFEFTVDRSHALFRAHEALQPLPGDKVDKHRLAKAVQLENDHLGVMEHLISGEMSWSVDEYGQWWEKAVDLEMKAYAGDQNG